MLGPFGARSEAWLFLRSQPSELAIPVNPRVKYIAAANREKAGNRAYQEGVIFKTQQHIDEGVKEPKTKKSAEALNPTLEDPPSVCQIERMTVAPTSKQGSRNQSRFFQRRRAAADRR